MAAHLTLPYSWVNCVDPENCPEYIHLQDTAENLNSYPLPWVEEIIGNCTLKEKHILFHNTFGQPHNETGPAYIADTGTVKWYQNGELHRENGPAITHSNGHEEWYDKGERHRDNGPAFIAPRVVKEWWIHGKHQKTERPPLT